jgi:DNA polymerase-3 subunit alpha
VEDYAKRVNAQISNKRVWESLIKSGAFDKLGDRSDLLFNLESLTEYARKVQANAASGQGDLFGALQEAGVEVDQALPSVRIVPAPQKYTDKEMLGWERELLGLYLSAHPLDKYDTYFQEQTVPFSDISSDLDGVSVTVGGVVSAVRVIMTKNNAKMAFVRIEDKTGEGEAVIFPRLFEGLGEILVVDKVVKITGKISGTDKNGTYNSEPKILADSVVEISDAELDNYQSTGKTMAIDKSARNKPAVEETSQPVFDAPAPPTESGQKLYIHVKDPEDAELLTKTKQILSEFSGDDSIIMVLGSDKNDALKLPFTTAISDELLAKLERIYDDGCVVVK